MNTCQIPQNLAATKQVVAANVTDATRQQYEALTGIIDKSAVALIEVYDRFTILRKSDSSFFAEQLQTHFGPDMANMRVAINKLSKLAADTAKASAQ